MFDSCNSVRAEPLIQSLQTSAKARMRRLGDKLQKWGKKQACSNSPVPLCTCWTPALEDKAWPVSTAAQKHSSTRPEKSASLQPSEPWWWWCTGELFCGVESPESHRCRIWGNLYRQISLFSVFFFLQIDFLFSSSSFFYSPGLIIPPATMWLVTLSLPRLSTQNRWCWWLWDFHPPVFLGFFLFISETRLSLTQD